MYQKNYDSRTYVKEAGKLIRKLTDEKVKNKVIDFMNWKVDSPL